jgi:mRNA interferase RelE/StbE
LYKIKLRQLGYRLVYSVSDTTVTVIVLAVGKRNRNEVYDLALSRKKVDKP